MRPLVCVKCVLCGGWLPTNKDDILLTHMRDHHRVFVHLPLLTSACFLDEEGIEATMAFINQRISPVKDVVGEEEEEEDQSLSDPLEPTEMETSSLKEETEAVPAIMEEMPDISQTSDRQTEMSVDNIDQKSWELPDTSVLSNLNKVSVESSTSGDNSYQIIE